MRPSTVLLIDPDQDSLVIYSLFLEHNGYRVLRASDGDEGYRLAREERPDVIVTELHLPLVSGRHVTEVLRSDGRTSSIPLVAVTTLPTTGVYLTQRCDSLLVKPCVPTRMLQEVSRFAGQPASLA